MVSDKISPCANSASSSSEAPFSVVIIDDDDSVRESMRMLLEVYGYVIREHASAESFLTTDQGSAGVLLVDHHMPGITGIELLELVYAKPAPPPALMITGRVEHTVEARLDRIGVKLLHKPVPEDELIGLVEAIRCASASNQASE